MARPKKYTKEQSTARRKEQTRKAVRRTRAKKAGMTVISETGVTIVTEDFLTGERTVTEDWEKPKASDYVSTRVFDGVRSISGERLEKLKKSARKALAKGVQDDIEIVLADPRGTLKIDDSIPDQPVTPEQVAAFDARRAAIVGVSANADKPKSKRKRTPNATDAAIMDATGWAMQEPWENKEVIQGSVGKEEWES